MALPQRQDDGLQNQPNPGQVRRVKTTINDDFSYLNEAANEPSYRAPTNERYAKTAYQDNVLKPVGLGRDEAANEAQRVNPDRDIGYATPGAPRVAPKRSIYRQPLSKKSALSGKEALAEITGRARATTISIAAFSWGVPLYLVQLLFALLSIFALGVVSGIDSLASTEGGFLSWVAGKVVTLAAEMAKFVGIDFAKIAMEVFTILYVIVLAIGMIMIAALYLQYKLGMLNPIFGKGSSLKIGMLLLTIIGLSMPLLNLFPFILLWMAAVWLYPR
jgi:hypothetical protein